MFIYTAKNCLFVSINTRTIVNSEFHLSNERCFSAILYPVFQRATMFLKKTERYAKLFFIISLCGLKIYAVLAFYTFHNAYTYHNSVKGLQDKIKRLAYPDAQTETEIDNNLKLRFILIWSGENETTPTHRIGEGQMPFKKNNCTYNNCIITTDKNLLDGDYRKFDAVVINVTYLKRWKKLEMPILRAQKQKYVFYGLLAAGDFPVCNTKADDYFNWTWSYKIYSDIFAPFIEVKSFRGNVVAPNIDPKWENYSNINLSSISMPRSNHNTSKPRAVAWIMNKCGTRINRMEYVIQLKEELKKLNHSLDIYGCGNLIYEPSDVNELIRRNYYFYLVFEDSMSEDYMTTEILKAYDNHVLPIVLSGADLTRYIIFNFIMGQLQLT